MLPCARAMSPLSTSSALTSANGDANIAMERARHDREFVTKLVTHLLEHPCIYATDRRDFKDVYKKEESWVTIAEELGTTPDVVQKRYKSLRDVYTRLKRNKAKKKRQYMTWPYFEQMAFLDPYLKPGSKSNRRPRVRMSKADGEEDSEDVQDRDPESDCHENDVSQIGHDAVVIETEVIDDEPLQHETFRLHQEPRRSTQPAINDRNEFESSLVNILDVVLKRREEPTESSLWAQSIAMRLDRMTPYKRAMTRVKIENVLLEMEFD